MNIVRVARRWGRIWTSWVSQAFPLPLGGEDQGEGAGGNKTADASLRVPVDWLNPLTLTLSPIRWGRGKRTARAHSHPQSSGSPRLWLPLFAAVLCLADATLGATGKGQTTFDAAGVTQDVFTYRPANFSGGPLLIVMHGLGRNADGYRDYAVPLADRFGLFVAAPLFDTKRFPSAAYQRGNVLKDGQPQPKDAWTYSRVAELARELRRREGDAGRPVYLIGHSAGGQFLTRYAAFLPGDATRIVAANPGSHLFPTRDLPFPYGFGGLPDELANDDAIKRYLAAPLTLLLGTADLETKDLDLTATAMKQGATRLERGRNCFALARDVAKKNGWPLNWRLVEVPGVGHSGEKMFAAPQAAEALFGSPPAPLNGVRSNGGR
jgi:poly(3-hydroxybutyrate) depolymerase